MHFSTLPMLLGKVTFLDITVFLVFLSWHLLVDVGFCTVALEVLRALPFLGETTFALRTYWVLPLTRRGQYSYRTTGAAHIQSLLLKSKRPRCLGKGHITLSGCGHSVYAV